jgi:hypothetical protein
MSNNHPNLNRQLESLGLTLADLPSVAEAREAWAAIRAEYGFAPNGGGTDLLAEGANVKIAKNELRTWTLTLTPSNLSDVVNTCTWATKACREACVMWTAGRQYDSVRNGRAVRTAFLHRNPAAFLAILTHEVARRERAGVPFGLRLNVASDLRWENIAPWLFEGENVRAYDYTKAPVRDTPANYKITYSHSERWTDEMVAERIAAGQNVAMIFDVPKHELPATYNGFRVIDGDLTDYRYGDPEGVIVGLAAKGAAKLTGAEGQTFVKIAGRKAA